MTTTDRNIREQRCYDCGEVIESWDDDTGETLYDGGCRCMARAQDYDDDSDDCTFDADGRL